ncbi:alpha/beta fold hydrolase [Microbulbifer pacificus]|uniref:Alpha/beta hydrolase n=1 Tax=Microbulbifer pacificus TaxID=407164 RepID=A0AAU0N4I4_9GAMM|nr:alpha/beta hydrolase [Microbulbifer pacificus]WOX07168.1 alpha/beta hydrolase [Microbulbifer pacificus]
MKNRKVLRACLSALCTAAILQAQLPIAAAAENYQVQPRDAQLSNYPYPYPVKFLTLPSQQPADDDHGNKLRMAYMDVGPSAGDTQPQGTVLLLHGKNFSGAYWQSTIQALSDRGYRVIVPDQIGFGKSSKPLDFQFSFQALAEHTNTLLKHLGIHRVQLAGHSMGGMLAARFALMYPQSVEKLILINPIGLEDWKTVVPYQPIEEAIAAEKSQTPEMVKGYMTQAYFDGKWKPEYNTLLDIQGGWTIGADAEKIAVIDARTSDMVFTQPVVYEFPGISAPTLLIIGTRDKTAIGRNRAPKSAQLQLGRYDLLGKRAAEKIPHAKLVELENVGHVPQYEAFSRYIKAMTEFLQSNG